MLTGQQNSKTCFDYSKFFCFKMALKTSDENFTDVKHLFKVFLSHSSKKSCSIVLHAELKQKNHNKKMVFSTLFLISLDSKLRALIRYIT